MTIIGDTFNLDAASGAVDWKTVPLELLVPAATEGDKDALAEVARRSGLGALTQHARRRPALVVEAKQAGHFEEGQHPRDKHGRFISIGAHIDLGGGHKGEVTHVSAGEVTVKREDGKSVTVKGDAIKNATVTKGPADGARAAAEAHAPDHAAAPHAAAAPAAPAGLQPVDSNYKPEVGDKVRGQGFSGDVEGQVTQVSGDAVFVKTADGGTRVVQDSSITHAQKAATPPAPAGGSEPAKDAVSDAATGPTAAARTKGLEKLAAAPKDKLGNVVAKDAGFSGVESTKAPYIQAANERRLSGDLPPATHVDLSGDFVATQDGVHAAIVEQYLKGDRQARTDDVPIMVKHGGKHYVMSGHHRVAAALLSGDKMFQAHMYESDTPDKPAESPAVGARAAAKPTDEKRTGKSLRDAVSHTYAASAPERAHWRSSVAHAVDATYGDPDPDVVVKSTRSLIETVYGQDSAEDQGARDLS